MVSKTIPVNAIDKDLSTFGGRFRAERDRLKLKQADLCAKTGVSKVTQIKYESNERRPDVDYLVALAGLGFDLMYLLTGFRSSDALDPELQNLVEAYSDAPEAVRRAAFGVLLSPYARDVERARAEPGWYRHEVRGEGDLRYTQFRHSPTLQDGPAFPGRVEPPREDAGPKLRQSGDSED